MMAKELGVTGMHGHSRIASPAFRDVTTVQTYQGRRKTPPVQKYEDLAACLEVFINRVEQGLTNTVVCGMLIEVHESHQRWHCIAGAGWLESSGGQRSEPAGSGMACGHGKVAPGDGGSGDESLPA